MSKSTIYQIIILVSILLIVIFTYYSFFYKNINQNLTDLKNQKLENQIVNNEVGSKIDEIYYISKDEKGNSYEITAMNGELDPQNLNILKLKDVRAIIIIKNSGTINISSKNALYNRDNLNTYFYQDVNLNFNEHIIASEIIDMNYIEKNIKISENVSYKNNNNFLNTDIIEIDMLTKISKIYMKNKKDKIKAQIFN
tara:strand:- start:256 stop:846 length:591 start_codon:yes stop_codon:yes gene_type:complete